MIGPALGGPELVDPCHTKVQDLSQIDARMASLRAQQLKHGQRNMGETNKLSHDDSCRAARRLVCLLSKPCRGTVPKQSVTMIGPS